MADKNKYSISSKLDNGVHRYIIFKDENMKEHTIEDISKRLSSILNNSRFQSRINTANNNWLEVPIDDVTESILNYFEGLTVVSL